MSDYFVFRMEHFCGGLDYLAFVFGFPGAMALDDERLKAFSGQVDLYPRAIRQSDTRECRDYWMHQPIAGLMIRIELVDANAT